MTAPYVRVPSFHDQCTYCNLVTRHYLRKKKTTDASLFFFYQCEHCLQHCATSERVKVAGKLWVSKKEITECGFDPDNVPAVDSAEIPKCWVCGGDGWQWHHYAPKHLFPDNYHRYPIGPLCSACHHEWHEKMTPNMSAKKSA